MMHKSSIESLEYLWEKRGLADIDKQTIEAAFGDKSEVVVAEAVELAAFHGLTEFRPQLERMLRHSSGIVRCYTVGTLYELFGENSLQNIFECEGDPDDRVKVLMLTIRFFHFRDPCDFKCLESLLEKSDCDYHVQYVFLHAVQNFNILESCSELVSILKKILAVTEPAMGIHKDINAFLSKGIKTTVLKVKAK